MPASAHLIPCDACRGDAPDPGIAARERAAIGLPAKGACCAWSRAQLGLPAEVPSPPLCAGCAVRAPFEHRCHGAPCACPDCVPPTPAERDAILREAAGTPVETDAWGNPGPEAAVTVEAPSGETPAAWCLECAGFPRDGEWKPGHRCGLCGGPTVPVPRGVREKAKRDNDAGLAFARERDAEKARAEMIEKQLGALVGFARRSLRHAVNHMAGRKYDDKVREYMDTYSRWRFSGGPPLEIPACGHLGCPAEFEHVH